MFLSSKGVLFVVVPAATAAEATPCSLPSLESPRLRSRDQQPL